MSGGSWDYFYQKLEEVAEQLSTDKEPLRRAFGNHLKDCAIAMYNIEWVDSCDMAKGDERESIEKALGSNAKALEIQQATKEAQDVVNKLERLITSAASPLTV
jgi:hypothetical protein